MSAKAGSIGSIVLGIAIAVVGVLTIEEGGWALIPIGIGMIAGGAYGLTLGPESLNQDASRAKDLNIASSGEGFPVPVIFGEQKVTGNFMLWSKDNFTSSEVRGETSAGGKGGGGSSAPPPLIGYDYHLPYEYGLCMGPVDACAQVWSSPGEIPMRGVAPSVLAFSGDILNIPLAGENESGTVRLYRGSATQVRNTSGDPYAGTGMNYRHLCYGVFLPGFTIGRTPQPKSYAFILRRLPKCIRDDGSTVLTIQTNGSANPSHPNYKNANPVAIVYEILTNKIWGRGLSSTVIDETTAASTSDYFRNRNIGMAFTIDSAEKLTSILDAIRNHLKLLLIWDGDHLKFKCLLDPTVAHYKIQQISKSDVIKASVIRPTWFSTVNEVRAEFVNASRNYRPDAVHAPDLSNQQITGKASQKQISLNGFTDWNTTRRQAFRIMREISYPAAAVTLEINRFKSQLEVGDCFRFYWDEWGANPVTLYCTVLRLEEAASDSENIRITAVEDPSIPSLEGTESGDIIASVTAWELIPDVLESDIQLYTPPSTVNGEITPIRLIEAPAIATRGKEAKIFVLGQKTDNSLLGIETFWTTAGGTNFHSIGTSGAFSITGTMLTALDGFRVFDRTTFGFQFSLTSPSIDESNLLGFANKIPNENYDLETLIQSDEDFIVIGEEIMQVGLIVKLATNQYKATNLVRGRFGSKIVAHSASEKVFYIRSLAGSYPGSALPEDQIVDLKAYPKSTAGTTSNNTILHLYHSGAQDTYNQLLGLRPLGPQYISHTTTFSVCTVTLRPRFYDNAAGTSPTIGKYNAASDSVSGLLNRAVTDLQGMTFLLQFFSATGAILNGQGGTPTQLDADATPNALKIQTVFNPGNVGENLRATVTINNIPLIHRKLGFGPGTIIVKKIRIFAVQKGHRSIDFVDVSLP